LINPFFTIEIGKLGYSVPFPVSIFASEVLYPMPIIPTPIDVERARPISKFLIVAPPMLNVSWK
jgi:hypothetical protein